MQEDTKDKGWWEWPLPIRKREPEALAGATAKHKTDIERFIALQYLFDRQWKAVKVHKAAALAYCGWLQYLVYHCMMCM